MKTGPIRAAPSRRTLVAFAQSRKWLCAPKGSAFLYVAPGYHEYVEPLVVSHGWSNRATGSPLLDNYLWTGTMDPSAYLSVPAAIRFQQENDWAQVRTACHQFASQTRRRIEEWTGLEPICPDSPVWYSQMFTARLPAHVDPKTLHERLWNEYRVEAPVMTWNGETLIRISIQAYTTPEHIDRLLYGMQEILTGH